MGWVGGRSRFDGGRGRDDDGSMDGEERESGGYGEEEKKRAWTDLVARERHCDG